MKGGHAPVAGAGTSRPRAPDRPRLGHKTLAAVRAFVRASALWRRGDTVLLACSGGADSMVAWELLARLRPSLDFTLCVAQVDHHLRPDAAAVAQALDVMAARTGVAWQRLEAPIEPAGGQLESRARQQRYIVLEAHAAAMGASVIATAHHADDQAETVLMRLLRGAGPTAWRGVRAARGRIVRPLLHQGRAELRALAAAWQVPFVEDPSNATDDVERNRIRHLALPALEACRSGAARGLVRSVGVAVQTGAALDHWLDHVVATHGRPWRDPQAALGPPGLALPAGLVPAQWPPFAALLHAMARAVEAPPPSLAATRQAWAWWHARPRTGATALAGLRLAEDGESLVIRRADVAPCGSTSYLAGGESGDRAQGRRRPSLERADPKEPT